MLDTNGFIFLALSGAISFGVARLVVFFRRKSAARRALQRKVAEAQLAANAPPPPPTLNKSKLRAERKAQAKAKSSP
jgi:hypothetical protein